MDREDLRRLIDTLRLLKEPPTAPRAVLMPDFYLDHYLTYDGSLKSFVAEISEIARRGGGIIPGARQRQAITGGGCSVNAAWALSALGIKCHLILRTSPLGLQLLRHFLSERVDLSHVKDDGKIALTVALELEHGGRRFNIMANDPGSIVDFEFDCLTDNDLSLIRDADYVCVLNWSSNLRGTELTRKVFEFVRKKGRGRTFFDPADPSPRIADVNDLIENVLRRRLVRVFSVNENEAFLFATHLDKSLAERAHSDKLVIECAGVLRDRFDARIDLHTATFSATFDETESIIPTFLVTTKRLTGAGDIWNAADIYGDIMGLEPDQRLLFANAVAACYVSKIDEGPPTKERVIQFLETARLRRSSIHSSGFSQLPKRN